MHPRFDPTRVRIHDLQIMIVNFMSLRRFLTTLPSGTTCLTFTILEHVQVVIDI